MPESETTDRRCTACGGSLEDPQSSLEVCDACYIASCDCCCSDD